MKELGEFSGIKKRQELRQQQLLRRTEQLVQSEDVHADVSGYTLTGLFHESNY